jgi:hypothetical protein
VHKGGQHPIVWGVEWSNEKKTINIKYTVALFGRQLANKHTTTNQK